MAIRNAPFKRRACSLRESGQNSELHKTLPARSSRPSRGRVASTTTLVSTKFRNELKGLFGSFSGYLGGGFRWVPTRPLTPHPPLGRVGVSAPGRATLAAPFKRRACSLRESGQNSELHKTLPARSSRPSRGRVASTSTLVSTKFRNELKGLFGSFSGYWEVGSGGFRQDRRHLTLPLGGSESQLRGGRPSLSRAGDSQIGISPRGKYW